MGAVRSSAHRDAMRQEFAETQSGVRNAARSWARPREEEARAEQHAFDEALAALKADLAAVKADLAWERFRLSVKYG